RRVEAADHRLDRLDDAAHLAEMTDKRSRNVSFAHIRAGGGDEDCGHGHLVTRRRTLSASRSISASGCWAVNAKRSRAVPGGTVGGRMPTTRKPSSSRDRAATMVASLSPRTSGTIALCGSGRLSDRVNRLALRNGSAT